MDWICAKSRLIGNILISLKIEPFMFVFVFSFYLTDITALQLVQDKICLNKYKQTADYCIGVSTMKTEPDNGIRGTNNTKNEILADLAQYTIYMTIIGALPSFIYALFIGSWTDRYIHGRKISLLLGTLGYIGQYAILLLNAIKFELDVFYILLAYIPTALTGGFSCILLSSFSYLTHNSSERYRLVRFTAFDITVSAAGPLGTYLGGMLLGKGYLNASGSIHNYEKVLATSLAASIAGFIWIFIAINENKSQNEQTSNNEEIEIKSINGNNNNNELKEQKPLRIDTKFQFSKIFDIQNLKDVFSTAFKVRPDTGRAQIWMLYMSMCVLFLAAVKDFPILFPYVEEVYNWDAEQFSQIKSIASIVQVIATSVIVFTLSAYFKVGDTKLGIIGCVSLFLSALCIGSVINPFGLYLMYILGSPSGIISISIRSLLSKLTSENEKGRIFSLLAALEAFIPALIALLYSTLFKLTIDFYPSLCFQVAGALMFLPIFAHFWIDLTRIH